MNEDRDKMWQALEYLLARAASTDPDDAITGETPLSVEQSGKYVNVLFSTGGPHTEFLAEYWSEEDAQYWFESVPAGGWFTRKDWGTREDVYVGNLDASRIMDALSRTPDELSAEAES